MTNSERKFYEELNSEDKALYRITHDPELMEVLEEDAWEINFLHGDSWADDLNF